MMVLILQKQLKPQEDLADGKYVYKTLVTDLAGNSSETATVSVIIETVPPKLNVIKLTNNTDTGGRRGCRRSLI